MTLFDDSVDILRAEGNRAVLDPDPFATHYIEWDRYPTRSQVYTAICGAHIHASEVVRRTNGSPDCLVCARILREYDAEECPF